MKRIIAIISCILVMVGLVACGGAKQQDANEVAQVLTKTLEAQQGAFEIDVEAFTGMMNALNAQNCKVTGEVLEINTTTILGSPSFNIELLVGDYEVSVFFDDEEDIRVGQTITVVGTIISMSGHNISGYTGAAFALHSAHTV